jgi:hypothetical protein
MIGNSPPTLFSARMPSSRSASALSARDRDRSASTSLAGVENWIARHPVVCVSSALLLGAMVGWLIKRK